MKAFVRSIAAIFLASACFAQDSAIDPCSLVTKEELTRIFGEIKEGPKTKEGLQKEKICEWTNASGSWIDVSVYSADGFGMKKGMANDPVDLKGLGDEAFSAKRGTDAEVYIRKGKLVLEVRTSAGREIARKTAEAALKKLP